MDSRKLFTERRSVNFFDTSKDLDLQTVKDILNLAVYAPSAFNLQPWRVIVVKSEANKEKLFGLAHNQPKVKEAPVTLILVGNKNGWDNNNPVWDEMLKSVGGNQQMVEALRPFCHQRRYGRGACNGFLTTDFINGITGENGRGRKAKT